MLGKIYEVNGYVVNSNENSQGFNSAAYISFPVDEEEKVEIFETIGLDVESNEYHLSNISGDYPPELEKYFCENTDFETVNLIAAALNEIQDDEEQQVLETLLKDGCDFFIACGNIIADNYEIIEGNCLEDLAIDKIDSLGGFEELDDDTIYEYTDLEKLGTIERIIFQQDEARKETASEYWCGRPDATDYDIAVSMSEKIDIRSTSNYKECFMYEEYGNDIALDGNYVIGETMILDLYLFDDDMGEALKAKLKEELSLYCE